MKEPVFLYNNNIINDPTLLRFTVEDINPLGVLDLFGTGYYSTGQTLIKGLFIDTIYYSTEIKWIYEATSKYWKLDLRRLKGIIASSIPPGRAPYSPRYYLLFSGGIDSTYLALQLKKRDCDFIALHIIYKDHYDESSSAAETAEMLDIPFKEIVIDNNVVADNVEQIIKDLGVPYDRGSVIPLWFLMKEVPEGRTIIAGDSGDCVFAPSMKAHIKALTEGLTVHEAMFKLSDADIKRIFSVPNILDYRDHILSYYSFLYSPLKPNSLEAHMLVDIFSEIPYYYRHRYFRFALVNKQRFLLPYQNVNLFCASLAMKDLHYFPTPPPSPSKIYLRLMAAKECKFEKLKALLNPKGTFKVEPETYDFLADKYLDQGLLREMKIFNDIDWWKESARIRYLATLLCIYFNKVLRC